MNQQIKLESLHDSWDDETLLVIQVSKKDNNDHSK